MATHTKPNGSPFTPFAAVVLAWRERGSTGADRAYASGVVIHEDLPEQARQRISLWLSQTMSGFDGSTLVALTKSGPKYLHDCAAGEAWAPIVQEFERKIAKELGEEWTVEIRLSLYEDRPEKVKRT